MPSLCWEFIHPRAILGSSTSLEPDPERPLLRDRSLYRAFGRGPWEEEDPSPNGRRRTQHSLFRTAFAVTSRQLLNAPQTAFALLLLLFLLPVRTAEDVARVDTQLYCHLTSPFPARLSACIAVGTGILIVPLEGESARSTPPFPVLTGMTAALRFGSQWSCAAIELCSAARINSIRTRTSLCPCWSVSICSRCCLWRVLGLSSRAAFGVVTDQIPRLSALPLLQSGTEPLWNLGLTIVSIMAAAIFGTQAELFRGRVFWRKRSQPPLFAGRNGGGVTGPENEWVTQDGQIEKTVNTAV
ncbi:unnamed protein product [Mycena citricolor]|uniref:Uncharacterized protein n=1 Tax=Mycena citricolor TaxID=2018698 RepID=A0AAD2HH33_9AGAR|nr:unnamed protein product [Mycena citricolor]